MMEYPEFNYWLQATPDCAFLLLLAHWPGLPEPKRWPRTDEI